MIDTCLTMLYNKDTERVRTMEAKVLGEKLRQLRAVRKLSQEAVAEALHISRAKYIRIEKGDNDPSLVELNRLALLFDTTVSELLAEEAEGEEVVSFYRAADDSAEISYINDVIDMFFKNKLVHSRR